MNKFEKDLKDGNKGEKVVAEYLSNRRNYEIVEYRNDSKYDFMLRNEEWSITFEIKTDRYEFLKKTITGNMFIELSCSGRDSGIMVTEADYFVYYFPDKERAYLIDTNRLKDLIQDDEIPTSTQAGDGGRVVGKKLNVRKYKNNFITMTIPKDENIWKN